MWEKPSYLRILQRCARGKRRVVGRRGAPHDAVRHLVQASLDELRQLGPPSVWRSMPPIRAACARFIPSSTAANDKRRRLWLAFFAAVASRRSSPAEKSFRTLTAAGMARIPPAPWNQLSDQ